MAIENLPPGIILLVAAALIALTRGALRTAVVLIAPLVTAWTVWHVPDGVSLSTAFIGYQLEPLEGSAVRRLFALVFTLMTFVGGLYALRLARGTELAAAFAYAGGAIGVAFAGDLVTLFVYWEVMAIFSTAIVWCGGTAASLRAGMRYAVMHVLGGVILMVGIAAVAVQTGSVDVRAMRAEDFATWMLLIGLLVNAAAPPVSAWLADAYPEATPTGAVFLSAFTTKTAVLALILLFPGEPVLVGVGLYMVFYGIVYALLENDARRILAYSVVNQVGFMVCAIGIGTELALNGAAAHAFAHIVYKALLFMSAGVVLYRTGKRKCTDLGGLFRTMPLTCVCGIVGALSISGFPLTSGFTTKTLISEAAIGDGFAVTYLLLAAASAGVFLHAGIKFPWFVFFQKDSGLRPKDAPWNMALAMLLFAGVCIFLGVYPQPLYELLPYPMDYTAYVPGKVVFYLQLLLFSGLAFFLLLPAMQRTRTITLDIDWLWRVGLARLGDNSLRWAARIGTVMQRQATRLVDGLHKRVARYVGADGVLSRSWPIGTTAIWITILLIAYVMMHYVQ
ncbi:MAG TPA: Na(+)/H(+) antiporter subunit D [Steroidobacteraceae bacterium]|nr:Na(+)/H(+) antiporter subunit D [Steroidobacteraceae bacterium]